ncbi:ATP-binding protein [Thiocapsa marina]|nr:ATP-binding protein [Thiocapsa marina]
MTPLTSASMQSQTRRMPRLGRDRNRRIGIWFALLLLLPSPSTAWTVSSVPIAFSVLPEHVQSWEAAAALIGSDHLPPARVDIHLGHQPGARWFVAAPLGRDLVPPLASSGPILSLNVANLDLVELAYVASDGRLASPRLRTGDTLALGQRDVIGATLAFRLDPDLVSDHALLLRVLTIGQLSLVPRLTDAASFQLAQARSLLTGGMLAALAWLFALLMLFAGVATGDRRFLAFVMLSVPFGVTGLASIGQLAYFLPSVPAWITGRVSSALGYLVTAALIFSFYLIVRPPPSPWGLRRFWFTVAWFALLLSPIGLTDLHPSIAWLNNSAQLAFIAFVLIYGPLQWRGTSALGRIALAYLLATCATGIAVVARTWFPGLASLAVAYFWPINLVMQSLMLIAVLTVSGRLLAEVPEQTRRLEGARQARLRLAALARKFSGLLKVVSHEIRNPASSVRFVATNLRRGVLSPEDAAADLIRISNQLSDIVRGIQRQRDAFTDGTAADYTYDLHEKVAQVQGALAGRIDPARLDLEVRAESGAVTHLVDASRLVLVLTNLLDNAFKYGGRGRVRMSLSSTPERLELEVVDQGQGIAPSDAERIFDQFWRDPRHGHIPGWGLGLWASRSAVESLGGSMEYFPRSPQGAGFRVLVTRLRGADSRALA